MAKKNITTENKVEVTKKRQYKVLVLSNTFVEGRFYTTGDKVEVSEDYYNRVKSERDNQLQII